LPAEKGPSDAYNSLSSAKESALKIPILKNNKNRRIYFLHLSNSQKPR
jgi:hypothetical protein